MAAETKKKIELEIAHVLFIDIVGYSKLSINEQHAAVDELTQIVRGTEEFKKADESQRLIKIATGDGMALVFYNTPEAPVRCATELARALKDHRRLRLRMGIHSGPVSGVIDVTERTNLAGAGLNLAQRVMDCGDAGHILLSKHVAEDLDEFEEWRPLLHNLGACEAKHGTEISVVNLYGSDFGNPDLPTTFRLIKQRRVRRRSTAVAAALIGCAVIIGVGVWFLRVRTSSFAGAPEKSIAVLPFENLSEDKENAHFADGVQNEILTDLAKIADLKVISRTSVMFYKAGNPRNLREIAQQLGVAHVLEGSVQRAGSKVRVNAQLMDARIDKHLWAKTYDRDLADVFAIETELAQLIANELQAKLTPSEKASIQEGPTRDLVAYDFYVRAISLIDSVIYNSNKEKQEKDLLQAVDLLNQAVARDPNFVLAYCWLARAHDSFYLQQIDHTPDRLAQAKAAIDSAFQLKADSGDAHLALALHLYWGYFDYDRARAEVVIAKRTLPNNPRVFEVSGFIDRRQGRWSDAARNLERASELDPRSVFALYNLIVMYWQLRAYDQQRNALDRVLVINPNDIDARIYPARIEIDRRADTGPCRAVTEKMIANDPALAENETIQRNRFFLALFERDLVAADRAAATLPQKNAAGDETELSRDYWIGVVARMKRDEPAARVAFTNARAKQEEAVRARPDNGFLLCGLGLIDARLGRKEEALHEGRRAIELIPVAKNAADGPKVLTLFAEICACIGERDLAIEQLEVVSKIPAGPSYGDLRLSPFWDPLRGDPRFEKIVASLAPK